jgi:hypothetical protein
MLEYVLETHDLTLVLMKSFGINLSLTSREPYLPEHISAVTEAPIKFLLTVYIN